MHYSRQTDIEDIENKTIIFSPFRNCHYYILSIIISKHTHAYAFFQNKLIQYIDFVGFFKSKDVCISYQQIIMSSSTQSYLKFQFATKFLLLLIYLNQDPMQDCSSYHDSSVLFNIE